LRPFLFLFMQKTIQTLNLRCRRAYFYMKRFLFSLSLTLLWIGVQAQHGHEVIKDLHVHAGQLKKTWALPVQPKALGDTVKYFRFDTLNLPILEDFTKDYFFGYQQGTYTCPDSYSYIKFLVDDSYLDEFIGTVDSSYFITRLQQPDSSWVSDSILKPSYELKFFNYDNPDIAYDTALYYKNFHTLDSTYLSGVTNSRLIPLDSNVFVNDSFTLFHCFPTDTFLWTDHDVYVNNDYPIQPPTIGVATFDGADSSGVPYDWSLAPNYFPHGKADYLTSFPIKLGGYELADSVYFSFFYQAQGRGANAPQDIDSLVLQFLLPSGNWTNVWYSEGYSLQSMSENEGFNFVSIRVDSIYLYNGFRFRFLNWATLTGAVDLWHIDMIRLDKNRKANQRDFNDAAFVYNYRSPLKKYQSIPYPHYSARNDVEYMITDTVNPYIRNLNDSVMQVAYSYSLTGDGISPLQTFPPSSGNLASNSVCALTSTCFDIGGGNPFILPFLNQSYEFPSNASGNDSAAYTLKIFAEPINSDFNRYNDTVTYHQNFFNYYAYDDGTAENGYGLNVSRAQLAMRFKLYKQDYLRAVAMYFDPLTTNYFSANSPYTFTLKIWTGGEYPENLIYQKDSLLPRFGTTDFFTRINDFAYYFIDTTLLLDTGGYFFVGWEQITDEVLGLGFDRNINSNENMFFDIQDGNGWYQSELPGTWMIRPCFGDTFTTPIGIAEQPALNSFGLMPNPANQTVKIYSNQFDYNKAYVAEIRDLSGRVVLRENPANDISLLGLQSGVYLVTVLEGNKSLFKTQKLVVTH